MMCISILRGAVAVICTLGVNVQGDHDGRETTMVIGYTEALLTKAGQSDVGFRVVKGLGHDEAFRILNNGERITVEHQTAAGALYATQAVIRGEYESGKV